MTNDYATKEHDHAVAKCNEARAIMAASKHLSRKWKDAEESLNFWQGKVANMEAAMRATR